MTILRDNREQKPWEFPNSPVETRNVTISTGDYTVAELCEYDDENDTYHPNFAVERKSGPDFIQSITHGRARFKREVRRAEEWDKELQVLIEDSKRTFRDHLDFMQYRDVSSSQVFGTVDAWERYYNVEFEFMGDRESAQREAFDALSSRLGTVLIPSSD